MAGEQFVATGAIRDAVKGREPDVLCALGIDWRAGRPHISCPYPNHDDNDPSWRWVERRSRAHCTCIASSHGIFDVAMEMLGLDFAGAKLRVAEIIGRNDLIRTRAGGQKTDPASLLNPHAANRDDSLVALYLAARLGLIDPNAVPVPTTKTVGWKQLAYYDPPKKKGRQPNLVAAVPCAVFETIAADGRGHAHRIYLSPTGDGKADLGLDANGKERDPKKSARLVEGQPSTAGCCVVWGSPAVEHVIVTEGIETATAVAYSFEDEIAAGAFAVMSAINAGGIEAFTPWPNDQTITVATDRDESKPGAGFKRGERAARALGLRLLKERPQVHTLITLPGEPGTSTDFLDLLLASGPQTVRAAILAAEPFQPTVEETELERINRLYPLPPLIGQRLAYRLAQSGEVWLYKFIRSKIDKQTGEETELWAPVCSPITPAARLRMIDEEDAYGLRVHLADMEGTARPVDFHRGELARSTASEIRSRLLNGGLRCVNGGENTVIEILKEARPEICLNIASTTGWQAENAFTTPEGEEI